MAPIEKTVDPDDIGLDPDRLKRIDEHFAQYVTAEKLPGFAVLVSRAGEVAHFATHGSRDTGRELPIEADTVYRIYSMTKPITSVAAMMLYEEGRFDLSDPVSKYLPEFSDVGVYAGGSSMKPVIRPASEPLRIWHLLTHTSGLSYGFLYSHPVDAMYRAAGFEWGVPPGADLAECCALWAGLPLMFEPGSSWNYSHSTDVVGRLIEVLSGKGLDEFFDGRIFSRLGMEETGFYAREDQLDRLATLYLPDAVSGRAVASEHMSQLATKPPRMLGGGGGLVSTIDDYHRFARMLLNGGELDGVRLLGPRTIDYMTRNHLPGDHDIAYFGHPIGGEAEEGIGFGLGFSVVINAAAMKVPASEGEFAWGGAASTAFWVDPLEELIVIFMTQLLPSSTHPIRRELRRLVYQSIVD
ncbi:MAG: serine hydrolase domain-containing protein [Acidimicrobiales bacterium]|jgi:CubicO group peptidase (beta-lactamase class C family)